LIAQHGDQLTRLAACANLKRHETRGIKGLKVREVRRRRRGLPDVIIPGIADHPDDLKIARLLLAAKAQHSAENTRVAERPARQRFVDDRDPWRGVVIAFIKNAPCQRRYAERLEIIRPHQMSMQIKLFLLRSNARNLNGRRACSISDCRVRREGYRPYSGDACNSRLSLTVVFRKTRAGIAIQPRRNGEHQKLRALKSQRDGLRVWERARK